MLIITALPLPVRRLSFDLSLMPRFSHHKNENRDLRVAAAGSKLGVYLRLLLDCTRLARAATRPVAVTKGEAKSLCVHDQNPLWELCARLSIPKRTSFRGQSVM